MTDEDRDDPNPYAPVPPGTPPPPRTKPEAFKLTPPPPRGRVTPEDVEEFLREYEARMGITKRPKLSRETVTAAPAPRRSRKRRR